MLENLKKSKNTTIVYVSAKFECELLIREGRRIADKTNTKLFIINVQNKSEWGKRFCKELDYLFEISKSVDAEMIIFFSDNPISILNDLIERENGRHIVIGKSKKTNEFEEQLCIASKKIEMHICKH